MQSEMARKKAPKQGGSNPLSGIPAHSKRAVAAVVFFVLAVLLGLSAGGAAGVAGTRLFVGLSYLLGIGYFLLPVLSLILGVTLARDREAPFPLLKTVSASIFFVAALAFVELVSHKGGALGHVLEGPVVGLFDVWGGGLLLATLMAITLILSFEASIPEQLFTMPRLTLPKRTRKEGSDIDDAVEEAESALGVEEEEESSECWWRTESFIVQPLT